MDKTTLLSYMPNYYRTSKVVDNLNNTSSMELNNFNKKLDSILNQFFLDSADFTLDRWEKELGIEVNNNYDISFRRSRILSKLRGQGTVTVSSIKNVAESFSNGEVDVIEDNPNYNFILKFVGIKGIPPNMEDLKNAIEEIKPAHLGFSFSYTYNTWDMMKLKTWGDVSNITWEELRVN